MSEIKKSKKCFGIAGIVFLIFVCFTICVKLIDVAGIGPEGSCVGFSKFNEYVHKLFGVHLKLYYITDILSIPIVLIGMTFGFVGLMQWIKRKKIYYVDSNLWALGIVYVLSFVVYAVFQLLAINKRPVLLNGKLEVSYPSSTVVLSIIFTLTLIYQFKCYVKNKKLRIALDIVSILYCAFLALGRLVAGVHWGTDIIGGLIISTSLMFLYYGMIFIFKNVQNNLQIKKNN